MTKNEEVAMWLIHDAAKAAGYKTSVLPTGIVNVECCCHEKRLLDCIYRAIIKELDKRDPPTTEPEGANTRLKDADLSIRAQQCLKEYGLDKSTVEEFSRMKRSEVKKIPGVGRATMKELEALLDKYNLTFEK